MRDYEYDLEEEETRRAKLEKEKKCLAEFLEDYDDDKHDHKYYRVWMDRWMDKWTDRLSDEGFVHLRVVNMLVVMTIECWN